MLQGSGPSLQLGASLKKDARPVSSPADAAQIALFAPYCGGLQQESVLLRVLPVFAQGLLEGQRPLAGGECRSFVLRWTVVRAPLMPCSCRLEFPECADVVYGFELPAHQLISWLMQVDPEAPGPDLPDGFWQWLLLENDPIEPSGAGPLH